MIFSIILSALKIVQHVQTKPAILASLKFETKPNSKNLEELGYIHFSYFDILKPSYRQIPIEDKVLFMIIHSRKIARDQKNSAKVSKNFQFSSAHLDIFSKADVVEKACPEASFYVCIAH